MEILKSKIESQILNYLCEKFDFEADEREFLRESDLFEDGIIDSVYLEDFFGYIEDCFSVELGEDFFFDERISTITGISEMILELKDK